MILELKGIFKNYQQGKMSVPVLKDVDFSMEEGEYVAIMGPSGSGKSTFLRCLNLLEQPTSGEVILDVENTGWFNKIAQTVFNKPQYTKVHLDAQGTFIWPLIDGKRTVTDIAVLVKEEFGEAAEPLYPRIIKYFQIVESYHFIKFANMPSK